MKRNSVKHLKIKPAYGKCSKHTISNTKSNFDNVKIVKKGSDIWHTQHCCNCGSIFKYKDSAAYKVNHRTKGLIREQTTWFTTKKTQDIIETEDIVVKCPCCMHENIIDSCGLLYNKVGEIEL